MELSDIYPPKYSTECGRQTLLAMKALNPSPLGINLSDLQNPDVIITPPHIRAPRGRRKK